MGIFSIENVKPGDLYIAEGEVWEVMVVAPKPSVTLRSKRDGRETIGCLGSPNLGAFQRYNLYPPDGAHRDGTEQFLRDYGSRASRALGTRPDDLRFALAAKVRGLLKEDIEVTQVVDGLLDCVAAYLMEAPSNNAHPIKEPQSSPDRVEQAEAEVRRLKRYIGGFKQQTEIALADVRKMYDRDLDEAKHLLKRFEEVTSAYFDGTETMRNVLLDVAEFLRPGQDTAYIRSREATL